MSKTLTLSTLGHTWILDLDGTIVKHNGYLIDGEDSVLPGVIDFLSQIPEDDMIIFITSRDIKYKDDTEKCLSEHGIRYNHIIYGAPFGERILINDGKPSGLKTSYSIQVQRDRWEDICIQIDESL